MSYLKSLITILQFLIKYYALNSIFFIEMFPTKKNNLSQVSRKKAYIIIE